MRETLRKSMETHGERRMRVPGELREEKEIERMRKKLLDIIFYAIRS